MKPQMLATVTTTTDPDGPYPWEAMIGSKISVNLLLANGGQVLLAEMEKLFNDDSDDLSDFDLQVSQLFGHLRSFGMKCRVEWKQDYVQWKNHPKYAAKEA